MIEKPDFMIVSGNGRNTGKTSFVERVLKRNCPENDIIAVKVSPHFHANMSGNTIYSGENFAIREENDVRGEKDSSRMLRAGAAKVYYIESKDSHLDDALHYLIMNEFLNGPVICESGGMRNIIKPSLFIVLTRTDLLRESRSYASLAPMADFIVHFENESFDPEPENIIYTGSRWEMDYEL